MGNGVTGTGNEINFDSLVIGGLDHPRGCLGQMLA